MRHRARVSGTHEPFSSLSSAYRLRRHALAGGRRAGDERQGGAMYFEIVTASGGYRARIRGDNNETMFASGVYTTKASAQNAINVVKAGAAGADVHDRT
jgi:uncharacterized protein YegP (UPF0339 family)